MRNHIISTFHPKRIFRKSISLFIFFTITPLALIISIICMVGLSSKFKYDKIYKQNEETSKAGPGSQIFASLPASFPSLSSEIIEADARPQLIEEYLKSYDSPLVHLSEYIVKTADKYNIDYRLITAIAQQESNLCKKIPPGSYNCWGWGIHSQGTLHFKSFEQGIDTVSQGLKENYIDKGYTNPDEIMKKYTPSSPGSWAKGVNLFMTQMR